MKFWIVVALLLISCGGWAQKVSKQRLSQEASKQRLSQQPAPTYPLKLHVVHSFVTQDQGVEYLHLVGVINGQKIELAKISSAGSASRGSAFFETSLLPPGDYAARLTGEDDKKGGSVLRQYDLLLANGKHESFMLVGLSGVVVRRCVMACHHFDDVNLTDVPGASTSYAKGCEECVKMGDSWVHLRECLVCGHVGCCDSSKNKHATKHFHATKHAVMRSVEPGEHWGWCYVDEVMVEMGR